MDIVKTRLTKMLANYYFLSTFLNCLFTFDQLLLPEIQQNLDYLRHEAFHKRFPFRSLFRANTS